MAICGHGIQLALALIPSSFSFPFLVEDAIGIYESSGSTSVCPEVLKSLNEC